MAIGGEISVDTDSNEVVIQNLAIQDTDIVSYLSEFDQDKQEEAIRRALQVGASAFQLVETSTEAEIVENRFNEVEREFQDVLDELQDELETHFDEDDGQLPRILEQHLGQDGHLKDHLENGFGDEGQFAKRLEAELAEDGEKNSGSASPSTGRHAHKPTPRASR